MTDQQIIEAYWRRDEAAIRETAAAYGSYCFTVANNILGDPRDAEECVSDTWLGAWNSIPPQRPGRLSFFLARLTRNLAIDRWRAKNAGKRGGGEAPLLLEELAQCAAREDVESQLQAQELGALVNRFAASLPERDRGLFLRRYFYGEPLAKAAGRYGLTPHHAAVILSRVRKKLAACLEKEELEG